MDQDCFEQGWHDCPSWGHLPPIHFGRRQLCQGNSASFATSSKHLVSRSWLTVTCLAVTCACRFVSKLWGDCLWCNAGHAVVCWWACLDTIQSSSGWQALQEEVCADIPHSARSLSYNCTLCLLLLAFHFVCVLYWHGICDAVLLKATLHHIHMRSDTKVIKRERKQVNGVGGFSFVPYISDFLDNACYRFDFVDRQHVILVLAGLPGNSCC